MVRARWPNRGRTLRRTGGSSEDFAREVARLSALDAATLRQRWMDLFGADPSPRLGRSLMVRAIDFRKERWTR
jgi:hypothetical protein